MEEKQFRIIGYSYSIMLKADGTLRFKTRRLGTLTERDVLRVISEVSNDKYRNRALRQRYSVQLKKERARLSELPPGELCDTTHHELYAAIEMYCSPELHADKR